MISTHYGSVSHRLSGPRSPVPKLRLVLSDRHGQHKIQQIYHKIGGITNSEITNCEDPHIFLKMFFDVWDLKQIHNGFQS